MNAPVIHEKLTIRVADLKDPEELSCIDKWVTGQEKSTPFHRPQWMWAVQKATGQKAHILLAEKRDGMFAGILPLHAMKSLIFGKAMVSSGFAVDGGVLADSQEAVERLVATAWRLSEEHNCPTLELRGGEFPEGQHHQGWQVNEDTHANFARPLTDNDEAELLAIPRKQRAEVRKGLKKELQVETGNGQRDLDWHYRVYSESVRNLGTPVFPKALMRETMLAFGDDVDILTVLHNGAPVASVLSLYHRGVVMPFWGGGIWEARALRANDVMYYALMNHARHKGCHSFDFGRSKVDSGAYFFKKNWGFEPQPLSYYTRTADGEASRDVNPNSAKYRAKIAIWKKLPLPVANFFGPFLARGLG